MKFDLKALLPHLAAIVFFAAFSTFYFYPQVQGMAIGSTDNLGWQGMSKEFTDYSAETGEATHWTTSMFGGMPTYQLGNLTRGNYISKVNSYMQLGVKYPIGMFFAASLCFYLMMLSFKVRPLLAAVGSLAFAYATFGLILYAEGHTNKYRAVAYLPLLIAGINLAFRKKYVFGGLLFALGMGLTLVNNHIQMTYYFALTIIFYGIARLVYDSKEGQLAHFAKATLALVVGLLLAVGSSATNLLPNSEYVEESVRGQRYLSQDANQRLSYDEGNGEGGFAWERAMSWSNGSKDVLACFVPMAAGGGRAFVDADTPYGKLLRRYQAQPNADGQYQAPLYHGDMSFTVGPKYFGAAVLVLFILGILLVKGPLRWWLVGGTLLIILISMGKNASILNRPLFDYFPFFNKFRAPDSAMAISNLLLATLGIIGVSKWLDLPAEGTRAGLRGSGVETRQRQLLIATASVVGFAVVMALLGPSLINFSNQGDAASVGRLLGEQAGNQSVLNTFINAIEDTRVVVFRNDAWRVAIFALLAGLSLFAILKKWVPQWAGIAALGVVILVDFHGISSRYHTHDEYKPTRQIQGYFDLTEADRQILADPDIHYRVFNTSPANGNPYSDSKTSYHHKSVGGYSAVKLRRYDDLINRQLTRGNQAVFNMLNTKYYLVPAGNGKMQAQRNPEALGNAWFVDNIQYVDSHDAEMAALNGFDPNSTAIVKSDEFADALSGLQPSGNGQIKLDSYSPTKLTYTSNNTGEGLAVFSEIWYGPDLGWKATIDGQPAELVRANYVLRAMRVPAGTHKIEMVFDPQSAKTGQLLSTIFSLLIILGFLGYIGYYFYSRSKNPDDSLPPDVLDTAPEENVVKPAADPVRRGSAQGSDLRKSKKTKPKSKKATTKKAKRSKKK
ncbi:MAG: YfhO family protein [Bacteroidota bacterium]